MRAVFSLNVVLKIAQETEFEHNICAGTIRTNLLKVDDYLGVFVFEANSQGDGTMVLTTLSTTLLGIQRYTTKRLYAQGIYTVPTLEDDSILREIIKSHIRAADEDTMARLEIVPTGMKLPWAKHNFPNGAGDLSDPPTFVIGDPELDELERLFGDPDGGAE
jgi:hypothetical protein